jgi:hypothetical protein
LPLTITPNDTLKSRTYSRLSNEHSPREISPIRFYRFVYIPQRCT